MSDPRYDYFNTSVDKEANQALVKAISDGVIKAVRPKEAITTPYVIGTLLDRAARGEVVRSGSDADFGLGGGELMAYVVVPLVTNLAAEAFKTGGVAGVGGLRSLPDPLPTASAEDVTRLARLSGIRISRKETMQVAVQINTLVRTQLEQAIEQAQTRPQSSPSRCAPYDCARLRQIFSEHFSNEELRVLCFDLEVPHEDIVIGKHNINVIELIEYFLRRGRLSELVAASQKEREGIDWS